MKRQNEVYCHISAFFLSKHYTNFKAAEYKRTIASAHMILKQAGPNTAKIGKKKWTHAFHIYVFYLKIILKLNNFTLTINYYYLIIIID